MSSGELQVRHFGRSGNAGPPLGIAATAAVNGLGFSAYQTWAFRRAEMTAFAESPFVCPNGKRATMAQVPTLDPRSAGTDRLEQILNACLSQMAAPLSALQPNEYVAVILALPPRFRGAGSAADPGAQRLGRAVTRALESRGVKAIVSFVPRGHAAFAFALDEAAMRLHRGHVAAALVGGADTAYDPEVVQDLIDARRLFDGDSLTAAIPGEGAALALLGLGNELRARSLDPIAWVEAVATNHEPATVDNDVSTLGLGLTRAARAITRRVAAEGRAVDWWISDLTPDPLRVTEFQLAFPRVARGALMPESALENLYENLGDLGAAAMPTALAIAVEGFRRGDPRARNCLITGSSDDGDRGVILGAAAAG